MLPEELARIKIDKQLQDAGWDIVSRMEYIPNTTSAVKEALMKGSKESDYLLFVEDKNYAIKYGLNPKVVYPHSFRHRFAKNFLEKFNDISLLADLMGHESIETTRIYLRKTASEQQEIVDKIVTW